MVERAAATHSQSAWRWWTLVAASVATFMLLLDFTVVNLALPAIQRDIGASFTDLRWVVDAYAVAMAAFILLAGSLADGFGHRRVFVFGVCVFALASLACGLAHRPLVLNAARAVQGVGAAATLASSVSLLAVAYQGRERQFSLAVWGAVSGTAVALGPVVGGAIVEYLSWHWIFFVNLPVSVVVVVIALATIDPARSRRRRSYDPLGALALALGLGALVFALLRGNAAGWGSTTIVSLLVGGGALLVAFAIIEARVAEPILELRLLRSPTMAAASLAAFAIGLTVLASLLFLSLYLQDVLRYAPLAAGLRLLPVTLGALVASLATLWLSRALAPRWIVGAGLALCGGAYLLMHGLTTRTPWSVLFCGFALAGAGTGLVNPTVAGMALRAGELARAGIASGLNSASRLLGLATGIGVLGAVFQHAIEARLHTTAPELTPQAAEAISAGIIKPVVATFPPLLRGAIRSAAIEAFVAGLNEIFVVCLAITFAASVLSILIARRAPAPKAATGEAVAASSEATRSEVAPAGGQAARASLARGPGAR